MEIFAMDVEGSPESVRQLTSDADHDEGPAWSPASRSGGRPAKAEGFDADAEDFGGLERVVLTHRGNGDGDGGNDKLVAFLHQPPGP
jgi:hypothetical protein